MFQSLHHDTSFRHSGKRECTSERALVLRDQKCFQRLVQDFGFGHGTCVSVIALMSHDRICKLVMSEILMRLIGISSSGRRSMQKSKTQNVIGRLVPSVFAVIEDRYPIAAVLGCKIRPLLGIHFIGRQCIVSSFYSSDAKVVHSFRIGNRQREFCLEKCIHAVPVDFVTDIYPIVFPSFRQ